MTPEQRQTARACLEAAEQDSMAFPQIVGKLIEAGFESYLIDLRRASACYYLPDGDAIELPAHRIDTPVAAQLDAAALQIAIREAQQLVPGYTYRGFCEKAASAGCAAYLVSFSGRRALYFGRDGATHTEPFPQ